MSMLPFDVHRRLNNVFDFDRFLVDASFDAGVPDVLPPLPDPYSVSARDVDGVDPAPSELEWDRVMRDPCPQCGAFRMTVGEYLHFGTCTPCDPYASTCN